MSKCSRYIKELRVTASSGLPIFSIPEGDNEDSDAFLASGMTAALMDFSSKTSGSQIQAMDTGDSKVFFGKGNNIIIMLV